MRALSRHKRPCAPVMLAIAVVLSCFAVAAPALSDHDRLRNEIRQFHDFLQKHPKVSTELRANPNLIKSKKYLAKHEDLERFLKRHPNVRMEIVNHPKRVFGRYYRDHQSDWNNHR